ncbi:amino acid adenylation domain-containing protein [Streptomyces mirabilis]|uniref:amino acid adenylation domain-containing protein n=1 Tax=Streptomyces mirabilis TaxID=68239 RepID=UPI0033B65BA8
MRPHPVVPRSELHGPAVERDCSKGLPGLVRATTLSHPDAVAVSDAAGELTYLDLEVWSDAVARKLRESAPGKPVAVAIPRSVGLLVALLGTVKAGLPYLPIDPNDPAERLGGILNTAGSTTGLGNADTSRILADHGLTALDVEALRPVTADADPDPLPEVAADHPVYVLFTSGSTGTPKGVLLPNEALCNRLLWMRDTYRVGPQDRILQKTPVTFDVSGWELWLPLISGATCVFLPPEEHRDPVSVARAIVEQRITVCHFVPSMLREFLRRPEAAGCTSLRHAFCSGERLPVEVAREFVSTLPAALHNLYGPTEAAIDVSHWTCPAAARNVSGVFIGRPIDNCVLLVLDEDGAPVPPGRDGELYIGGVPLALSYLNRPDLTAKAFVTAPRGSAAGRLYRTGDRVRLVDGELEYLGRADDQVKILGQRIEPQEIEYHLAAHPELNGAAVVAAKVADDVQLVAWVRPVNAEGQPGQLAGRLRSYVAARLPAAYVPTKFLVMDEIPVTSSGKLDRALLRERAEQRLSGGQTAPATSRRTGADRSLLREILRERQQRAGQPTGDASGGPAAASTR